MELLAMIVVIFIVLIIIYFINGNIECFQNADPINEVANIKGYYEILRYEPNTNSQLLLRKKIKDSITQIEKSLNDNYDKYKLNNLYYNEMVPLLDKGFSKENANKFEELMNNLTFLINYSLNPTRYNTSQNINDIKDNFKKLNTIYSDVYITKSYSYQLVANQIDLLTKKIYDGLLKITTHEDLNTSGIILILNTSLKRAYEVNDITEINSLMTSFNEKLKTLGYNPIDQPKKEKIVINSVKALETNVPASVIDSTTTISVKKEKSIISNIQGDFNRIYNAFDTINDLYKKNKNLDQIDKLNQIIYKSIDNIISYNKNDVGYNANILSIKTVIIAPILEKELRNSYLNDNINEIIRIKNKFYDGIVEIKNVIINYYSKTKKDDSRELCLRDIIDAILNNNYPIEVKKLNGCKNSIFLSSNDITIHPKMAISRDRGKSWGSATDYMEYKKTGKTNDPYLYTYKLATSSNGKTWSFL